MSLFGQLGRSGEKSQLGTMNFYFELQISRKASPELDDLLDRMDKFLGECGEWYAVDILKGDWIIHLKGGESLENRLADYRRGTPAEWNFRFILTSARTDFEVLIDKKASGDLDELCDHLDGFLGEYGRSYAAHGNIDNWVINVMREAYEQLVKRLAEFKDESPSEWNVQFNPINVRKNA